MRRSLLTVAIAASLLLAGCSADSDPVADPTPGATQIPAVGGPTAGDIATLAAVVIDGPLGATPTLTFDQPFEITAPVARLDVEGTGAVLADGQALTVDYLMVDGSDGSVLESTWESGAPQELTMGDPQIIDVLNEVLRDQRVGVRVLVAAPGGEATDTAEAYGAMVMVMEVVDSRDVPTRASGEAVELPDGLPVVTLAENGAPSIEIPAGLEEPTELVVQTLITGEGPVVETGQNVTVHYNGWLWDGTLFDSSWESGAPFPTPIGLGQLIAGWDEGLVGQTVGSQVLLLVPSDKGYGSEGYGEIPPDASLIFVVDILEVTPSA